MTSTFRITVVDSAETRNEAQALSRIAEELNSRARDAPNIEVFQWRRGRRARLLVPADDVQTAAGAPGVRHDSMFETIDLGYCDLLIGIFCKRFGPGRFGGDIEKILRSIAKERTSPQLCVFFREASATSHLRSERDQEDLIRRFKRDFPKNHVWRAYRTRSGFDKLVRGYLISTRQSWSATATDPKVFRLSLDSEIEGLIDQLQDADSQVRRTAVVNLTKKPGHLVAKAVTAALIDRDSTVRAAAAKGLGKVGGDTAVAALGGTLSDSNEHFSVRASAATALGAISGQRSIEVLVAALEVCDSALQLRIIDALRKLGGDEVIDVLSRRLSDQSTEVRVAAAYALERIAELENPRWVSSVQALAEAPLLQALKDSSSEVRRQVAGVLGLVGTKVSVPPLADALRDPSHSVRVEAALALGKLGGDIATAALTGAMKDVEVQVRIAATNGLSRRHDDSGLEALVEALKDEDTSVRIAAANALLELSDPRTAKKTVPVLIKALQGFGREKAFEETRAFIAHEVRSLLGPIQILTKSFRRAMLNGELDRDQLVDLAEKIIEQTEEAFRVVNRYVSYTKPLTPELQRVDLALLLTGILDEVRPGCQARDIAVTQEMGGRCVTNIDPALISQALRNVLTNAIEAVGYRGTITVHAYQTERRTIVNVSDTGCGIAPKFRERVFDLGFTTKNGQQGSGLGLALVRRVIDAHGGEVDLVGHASGKGATATISLPRTIEEPL
jgi:signal transduction histidine kinase